MTLAVAAHEAARRGKCRAGFCREPPCPFDRDPPQFDCRNDGIDEPEPQRLFRTERFAEQQKLGRLRHADPARQEQRGGRLRHDAEIDERHAKNCARRGIDEIAMQHHGRADADRKAFDRGDERRLTGGQSLDEREGGKFTWLLTRFEKISDIIARREHAARARKDDRANRWIAVRLPQSLRRGHIHGAGQRVLLFRPVEDHAEHRAFARDLDVRASRHHWQSAAAPACTEPAPE